MGKRGLILSGAEREVLRNPEDLDRRERLYEVKSRLRKNIENEFPEDMEILWEHPDLYQDFFEAVFAELIRVQDEKPELFEKCSEIADQLDPDDE